MTPIGKKISFFENIGRTLTRAAFVVGFFSLAASFLGMFRDRMLAGYFGAGPELDIYYAAFRVPDFFFNTILVSITSSAFLPVLTRYLHKPGQKTSAKKEAEPKNLLFPKEAQDFIESLTSLLMLGLFGVTLILWLTAPFLTHWIAPGFSPEQQQATTALTRIMLISPIFLSFSGILGNVLNLRNYFFFYSLTPFVYNLGSIFAILFFVPYLGIQGLAWGIVLGAILHFAIQFFPALSMGLKFNWQWNPFHPGIKKVFKMMLPRSFHLGLLQGNLIITTLLASILPTGSLTVFTFANNIQGLPLGLFAASFAIAAFPTLSILAAREDTEKFKDEFSRIMCQILFFIIPLSVIIIILRAQMVRIILGTGRFNWEDTVLTLNVLGVLAVSLFAQGLNLLFVRAFFALHDTVTPLKSAIVGVIVNVAIGALAIKHWGWFSPLLAKNPHFASMDSPIMGLALAYTASQIAIFIFLFVGLHEYLKGIENTELKKSLGKIALATLVMGAATQLVKWGWGQLIPLSTFTAVAGQIVLSGLVGVAIYLLISKILKSKELIDFYNECPKILGRKKVVPQ
jgi:putative peptidoglycan lipid II flippase